MATTIVTKYGSDAPATTDIVRGELAVDTENGRLYTENAAGAVVEIGLKPEANVDVTGTITATGTSVFASLDISGDIDVDGTTNLDVVDIDGAVQADGTVTVGVDDTGYDVKFFGATTGKSLLWDESADSLIVTGTTTMTGNSTVSGTLGVTGVLTGTSLDISGDIDVDGTTNLDVVDIDGAVDMASTLDVAFDINVGGAVKGNAGTRAVSVGTAGSVIGGLQLWSTTAGTSYVQFGDEAGTSANHYRGYLSYNHSTDTLALGASSSTKVSVNSTGIDVTGTATVDGIINSQTSEFFSSQAALVTTGSTAKVYATNTTFDGTNGSLVLQSRPTAGADVYVAAGATPKVVAKFHDGGDVSFFEDTGTTAKLFWDASAESLGIGTSSPTAPLTILSTGWEHLNLVSSDADATNKTGYLTVGHYTNAQESFGIISGQSTTSSNVLSIGGGAAGLNAATSINLYTASDNTTVTGTPRVSIDSSGNLLVGRTDSFTFSTNTTDGVAIQSSRIDVSAASVCRISQVRDSTGTYDRFYNGSSIVGSITGTTSATAYNTSSDQRLKENIADADDAGSKVDAIQVRKFDWKADGHHQDYGMIAQELQAVAPEAVSGDADSEEMMGVDYSKLVPMLIKEIQQLRQRVAQLED